MIRRLVRLALAGLVMLVGGSVSGVRAEPVRVGILSVGSANGWVSEEKGFWKAENLDVTMTRFASGIAINEALLSNSIDFGFIGFGPALFAASRDLPLIFVANGAYADQQSVTNAIVVAKDSPFKSIKDLDGKSVAVHSKGTIEHIMVAMLAEKYGIKMNIREVPFAQQEVALSRGDVDAVSAHTPHMEYMTKLRGHRGLEYMPGPAVPNFQIISLAVNKEYAEKNPDQVVRMVKAFINTNRWIMKNQEEAREIIAGKYLKYEPEMVAKTVFMKWPLNGEPMTGSLQLFAEKMKGLGLIQKAPDVRAFFPTEYIDKALASVGRVPDPDFERAVAGTPAR